MALSYAVLTYQIIIGVFHMVLIALAGAALAKLGPLDRVGEKKSAQANYYLFIPLYCFVVIYAATSELSRMAIGMLFLAFVVSSLVASFIAMVYCKMFKVDVRIGRIFPLIAAFGNVAFFPGIVVSALCAKGGLMESDVNCKMGDSYSMFLLFSFNVALLIVGPYFVEKDKALAYDIRRQMAVLMQFYNSPAEFMEDNTFSVLDRIQHEKYGHLLDVASPLPTSEKTGTVIQLLGAGKEVTAKDVFK